jgi:tellurite methyltransferase
MSDRATDDRERWDARWARGGEVPRPPRILAEHGGLVPGHGEALEIACGLGAGALWLAARGLDTAGWDVSPVALARLEHEARERGLAVRSEQRDVVERPPAPDSVDVLLVVRLLQTFVGARVAVGPRRPEWRLRPGEILQIAAGFEVLLAEEGPGEEAALIARRPAD